MARQIFIGLLAEGTTDQRFLEGIIQRTFTNLTFDCQKDIDIESVVNLSKDKQQNFVEAVLQAAKKGWDEFGITILCVHVDADSSTAVAVYQNKIQKAIATLAQQNENEYCKILVAIVPIQETEAWMLADSELLREQINTKKTANELGIHRSPETIANPKEVIEHAIKIAQQDKSKRRRRSLTIAELYLPLGQSVALEKLDQLPSYQDFKENIRTAFRQLNLLH